MDDLRMDVEDGFDGRKPGAQRVVCGHRGRADHREGVQRRVHPCLGGEIAKYDWDFVVDINLPGLRLAMKFEIQPTLKRVNR